METKSSPTARGGWFFLYKERMRFTSDSLTQGTPWERGHNVLKIRRLKGLLLLNPVLKSGSSTKLLLTESIIHSFTHLGTLY